MEAVSFGRIKDIMPAKYRKSGLAARGVPFGAALLKNL
jgi:hypothetical protein